MHKSSTEKNQDINRSVMDYVSFKKSLLGRLIVVVGVILGAAFVAFAVLNVATTDSKLLQKSERSAEMLTETVEKSLRHSMLTVRRADIQKSLQAVEELPEIIRIQVLDAQGNLRIDSKGIHYDEWIDPELKEYLSKASEKGRGIRWLAAQNRYRLLKPIRSEPSCTQACHRDAGKHLGYLDVEMDVAEAMAQIARNRSVIVFSAVVTLLAVALVIIYVIHQMVHRPVHRLVQTMAAVEAGNLEAHVEINSQDEIGWLAASFDRMVDRVRAHSEALVQAQKQLAQSEKLAAIGLLAAGVAHEINNPLATISMSTEALMSDACTAEQRRYFLDTISGESDRISGIIAQLLSLDRQQRQQRTPIDTNSLLDTALIAVQNLAKSQGVEIITSLDRTLPKVSLDPERMRQAFLNIVINAIQAMPDGGRLTVSTGLRDDSVYVRFEDEGVGISPENLERVFEPFFTTKETGEGFGLGLAVTMETVRKHGGNIHIESEPGRGTCVTVFLPLGLKAEVANENEQRT